MWGWSSYRRAKRKPATGIKAKTGPRQPFGQTWWGGQWMKALERLLDAGRLSRGRSYARGGQVLNLDIEPGHIAAKVQGSRSAPYKIKINLATLSDKQWDKVLDTLATQALFAAKLLAGEMPADIEGVFTQAAVTLFPEHRNDLRTECSCPDGSNPCKHIAAVYCLLAEQFDDDPFLLFRLRGRTKDQLMAELRQRRNAAAVPVRALKTAPAPETFTPLAQSLENFWLGGGLVDDAPLVMPEAPGVVLKQLGEPSFAPGFMARAETLYPLISESAYGLALGEEHDPANQGFD